MKSFYLNARARLRTVVRSNSFTAFHAVLQPLAMFAWMTFLLDSQAYASVYLLIGLLGFACRRATNRDKRRFFAGQERVHRLIAALFSLAVMAANYELFRQILTPFDNTPAIHHFYRILDKGICVPCLFLGGLYHGYFILRFVSEKLTASFLRPHTDRLSARSVFLGVFGVLAVCYTALLWLCFYPGTCSFDSTEQIAQVVNHTYTNHHPYYHTLIIRVCLHIGRYWLHDINTGVAIYSLLSILTMAAVFAYVAVTLFQMRVSRRVVLVAVLPYLLLPYHFLYSFTMWKDVPFGAFTLLFTVAAFRTLRGIGRLPLLNRVWTLVGALGMCLFRSNGFFAFVIAFVLFTILFGKSHRRMCAALACVIVAAFILKHPVLKALDVPQPDTIESLSVPAQQIARVVTDCGDLTPQQHALLSRIVDVDRVPDVYESYISDPVKNLVRDCGNQDYLQAHKSEYARLYVELGLSHPASYIKAWIDQTKGYWNAGYDYWRWIYIIQPNGSGVWQNTRSQKLANLVFVYCQMYPDVGLLQPFVSIGLHTWLLLLIAFVGWRKKDRLTVFLTVPSAAVILSLLIATPVSSEFRYAYALFCCLPFLAVLPFRPRTAPKNIDPESEEKTES